MDPETSEPTDSLTQEAREFCQKVGSKATQVSEVVRTRDPAVYRAIQDGIDRVNGRAAANVQRIQKWAVLQKDFSISGGEFGKFSKGWVTIWNSVILKIPDISLWRDSKTAKFGV